MPVAVRNIKISPDEEALVREKALAVIHKKEADVLSYRVLRRSVDARKKQVRLVYSVEFTLKEERDIRESANVSLVAKEEEEAPIKSHLTKRPVVVGTGPCGLFAALTLARAGACPLVLERGDRVEKRAEKVEAYWQGGPLDTNTNVQFGEGGAGTFSDGKLTTRINDRRCFKVLADFCRFGACDDILYQAKPHIGTDVLRLVIQNIRKYLESLGCEFRFNTALTDIDIQNGKIVGITTSCGDYIPCRNLILALGHSARDTYEMLCEKGIVMHQKPFSVGVRIEHLQQDIDKSLYGDYAGHPALGAASYQLSYKEGEDACYSFCMCPGGTVVAAASYEDTYVTNGMSYRARDGQNANSALCVNVDRRYFADSHPLAGVYFQRELEKKAFSLTGGKGAPLETVGSFLYGEKNEIGSVQPTYTGKTCPSDLHTLFPKPITRMMERGLLYFDRKIQGFAAKEALLTGPETRTSAPVRIERNEDFQSVSLLGLFPAGEGAGYAGGIMSAAVDGIKVAEKVLEQGEENE